MLPSPSQVSTYTLKFSIPKCVSMCIYIYIYIYIYIQFIQDPLLQSIKNELQLHNDNDVHVPSILDILSAVSNWERTKGTCEQLPFFDYGPRLHFPLSLPLYFNYCNFCQSHKAFFNIAHVLELFNLFYFSCRGIISVCFLVKT